MNKIIKNPFARTQKVVCATLCVVCTLLCWSCQSKNMAEHAELILGKWELIADGLSDDVMHEHDDGTYWEYFPDGTVRAFMYSNSMKTDGFFSGIGTYTIDANFLIRKSYDPDNGTCTGEQRYEYEFKENQLKLTRNPLVIHEMSEIYIANIFIFKQIK